MTTPSPTPGGAPLRCSICRAPFRSDASELAGEPPCFRCGHRVWWFLDPATDVTVVQFAELSLIDEHNVHMMGERVYRLVKDLGRTRIVVDFTNVSFLTSANVALLLGLHKRICAAQGRLALCHMTPQGLQVLERTRLSGLFRLYDTEEAAIASMLASQPVASSSP